MKYVSKTKVILRLIAVVAIVSGGRALIQIPLLKLSTPRAVDMVEKEFIRSDLTEQEQARLDFCKGWILSNNRQLIRCWRNTRMIAGIGMPVMGILLIMATVKKKQNN